VQVPIYQTAAFALGTPERADSIFALEESHATYSRTANPTVEVLENRLAALHGVHGAVALASGMTAVAYSLLNVVGKQGHVVSTLRLYGGTLDGFSQVYPELGISFSAVQNPDNLDEYEQLITPQTKAIFIESITNPFATVLDIEGIAKIAHKHDIALIVDNTLATPYLLNPFEFGADVVIYSATKAICGHGNSLAGIVLDSGKFDYSNGNYPHFEEKLWTLRNKQQQPRSVLDVHPESPVVCRIRTLYLNCIGGYLSPFDAYLILLGIDTLSERVQKQVANTQSILEYLQQSPHVAWVKYPSATSSPYRNLAAKYLPKGAGSVLSFGFKGTPEQCYKFLSSVKLFGYQANVGDARSLIINPAQTTHLELTEQQRAATGLTPDTIRLSLGLENPNDLIADLEQAFAQAFLPTAEQ
jgi:O-acetylhomoserine (thiol)-lyase